MKKYEDQIVRSELRRIKLYVQSYVERKLSFSLHNGWWRWRGIGPVLTHCKPLEVDSLRRNGWRWIVNQQMVRVGRLTSRWLEIDGWPSNGWRWIDDQQLVGDGWLTYKWLEMNGWPTNGWRWMVDLQIVRDVWLTYKWLELDGWLTNGLSHLTYKNGRPTNDWRWMADQ